MFELSKNILDPFTKTLIGLDFDNLRVHCEFVKSSLVDEKERFEKFAEERTQELNEDQKADFYEFYGEEIWQISDLLPSLQWMSTFLLSYGIFEKALNGMCHTVGRIKSSPLNLSDMAGKGIERAKLYLSKNCGVTSPFNSPEWVKIQNISKIRNVLAHASGELDLDQKHHKEVFNIAQTDQTIIVHKQDLDRQTATIELTAEFNINAIETFRSFLYSICDTPKPNPPLNSDPA
jgi:hypothetical protein